MGSVGDMRIVRAILLAIVATLALAGGITSTADAKDRPTRAATTVGGGSGGDYEQVDAEDPGFPPAP